MAELLIQFAFQIPFSFVHETENQTETWQSIIGLVDIWRLGDDFLPEFQNVNTIIYKCLMFAFILVQQNILLCEEYEEFIKNTLASIRSFSDRKAESMAYLHNNHKLKVTVKNQYEKDKMMKKLGKFRLFIILALVNRQVKKWNQTVFSKSSDRTKPEKKIKKATPSSKGKDERIHEVGEHLEDEKLGAPSIQETIQAKEAKDQIEEAKKRDKLIENENKMENMRKADLMHHLVKTKIGFIWKIIILSTKKLTNQILLVFDFDKLNQIFEDVKSGETTIYTEIEEKLYEDYVINMKLKKEKGVELVEDLKDEKSNLTEKATTMKNLLHSLYLLLLHILLSNSALFCYLFMVICMIMNGSILSLVYPISIFIYALLEEKRPGRYYWLVILYYTSIVLVLKFMLQTYPFSRWVTAEFSSQISVNTGSLSNLNSFNDILMAIRLGLENVESSGRNFAEYFLFEALILLSVTLHIFILVFGGVWLQREVEAESINQAASRITSMQRQLNHEENDELSIEDFESSSEIFPDFEEVKAKDLGILPQNYKELILRRTFSMDDCSRMRDVSQINIIL